MKSKIKSKTNSDFLLKKISNKNKIYKNSSIKTELLKKIKSINNNSVGKILNKSVSPSIKKILVDNELDKILNHISISKHKMSVKNITSIHQSDLIKDILNVNIPKEFNADNKDIKLKDLLQNKIINKSGINKKIELIKLIDIRTNKGIINGILIIMSLVILITSNPVTNIILKFIDNYINIAKLPFNMKNSLDDIIKYIQNSSFFKSFMKNCTFQTVFKILTLGYVDIARKNSNSRISPESAAKSMNSFIVEPVKDMNKEAIHANPHKKIKVELNNTSITVLKPIHGAYNTQTKELNLSVLGLNTKLINADTKIDFKMKEYNGLMIPSVILTTKEDFDTNAKPHGFEVPRHTQILQNANKNKYTKNLEIQTNEYIKQVNISKLKDNIRDYNNFTNDISEKITNTNAYNMFKQTIHEYIENLRGNGRTINEYEKDKLLKAIRSTEQNINQFTPLNTYIDISVSDLNKLAQKNNEIQNNIKHFQTGYLNKLELDNYNILYPYCYENLSKIESDVSTKLHEISNIPETTPIPTPPALKVQQVERNTEKLTTQSSAAIQKEVTNITIISGTVTGSDIRVLGTGGNEQQSYQQKTSQFRPKTVEQIKESSPKKIQQGSPKKIEGSPKKTSSPVNSGEKKKL